MSAEKSEASYYPFIIYIYCHDGFIYLAKKKKDISTSVSVLKTQ